MNGVIADVAAYLSELVCPGTLLQMYDAVDGRRPALPRLHSQRIATLDFEQVRAISDYLARIGWQQNEDSAPVASLRPHQTP